MAEGKWRKARCRFGAARFAGRVMLTAFAKNCQGSGLFELKRISS